MGKFKRTKTKMGQLAAQNYNAPTGIPLAVNSGYSDHGASHTLPAFENFKSTSTSPQRDIYSALPTLRSRSRVLAISAPLVTSALRTLRTYVVGRGLHLHCTPDFETLGISRDEARAWAKAVEKEFELWAADKNSVDVLGLMDFYEMQQVAYKSWRESGDAFVVFRHADATLTRPYSLRLQLLEADRICSPQAGGVVAFSPFEHCTTYKNGNKIFSGVEVDKKSGAVVAYHIASDYPQNGVSLTFERIEKLGRATGMPNILHLMDAERPEQLRGVPFVAPVIEQTLQLARYFNSEAMAALLENYHALYITTPDANKPILTQGMPGDKGAEERDLSELEPDVWSIHQLLPGEKLEQVGATRPGNQFAPFIEANTKHIGAAMELPGDVLSKSYNSSYSASRAAIQDFWRRVQMDRDWHASDFCAPVFEEWLFEAVARGRVQAPGFFDDLRTRKAWCSHQWNGSAMPHLDPVKEARALQIMVANGWLTNEQATTQLNGGDWHTNMADLEHEKKMLAELPQTDTPILHNITNNLNDDDEQNPQILEHS